MRLCLVAGARPNFVKVAPIIRALEARQHNDWFLVHTGQHYDPQLSDVFFTELGLPAPDVCLNVGSGSHAEQTARVMLGLEPVLRERRPDVVVVVGDVNSTLAAALVAAKLGIRLAHIEAGLRSGDRTMPEEINRMVTDALADVLFTTSRDAHDHLAREGITADKIHFVGNVMVDALLTHRAAAQQRSILSTLGLRGMDGAPVPYAVLTLHRPSNVDDPDVLTQLMDAVEQVSRRLPVIFAVHPRTRDRLGPMITERIRMLPPLGYLDFLALTSSAALILTDSGGLQEEATVLGVPCLTLRDNTERPVTIAHGTNTLVGTSASAIVAAVDRVLGEPTRAASARPELWDGRAAERIVDVLVPQ